MWHQGAWQRPSTEEVTLTPHGTLSWSHAAPGERAALGGLASQARRRAPPPMTSSVLAPHAPCSMPPCPMPPCPHARHPSTSHWTLPSRPHWPYRPTLLPPSPGPPLRRCRPPGGHHQPRVPAPAGAVGGREPGGADRGHCVRAAAGGRVRGAGRHDLGAGGGGGCVGRWAGRGMGGRRGPEDGGHLGERSESWIAK